MSETREWLKRIWQHRARYEQNWVIRHPWLYALKATACVLLGLKPNCEGCDRIGCYSGEWGETPVTVAWGPTVRSSHHEYFGYDWEELVVGHGFWPHQWWWDVLEESSI